MHTLQRIRRDSGTALRTWLVSVGVVLLFGVIGLLVWTALSDGGEAPAASAPTPAGERAVLRVRSGGSAGGAAAASQSERRDDDGDASEPDVDPGDVVHVTWTGTETTAVQSSAMAATLAVAGPPRGAGERTNAFPENAAGAGGPADPADPAASGTPGPTVLEVRVLAAESHALLSEAVVTVAYRPDPRLPRSDLTTVSEGAGARGTARIAMPAGPTSFRVTAAAPGRDAVTERVERRDRERIALTLVLDRAASLVGFVRASDDAEPLAGAEIAAYPADAFRAAVPFRPIGDPTATTRAGPDGWYELDVLPRAAEFVVVVRREKRVHDAFPLLTGADPERVLRRDAWLAAAEVRDVSVRTGDDDPVEGAWVYALPADAMEWVERLWRGPALTEEQAREVAAVHVLAESVRDEAALRSVATRVRTDLHGRARLVGAADEDSVLIAFAPNGSHTNAVDVTDDPPRLTLYPLVERWYSAADVATDPGAQVTFHDFLHDVELPLRRVVLDGERNWWGPLVVSGGAEIHRVSVVGDFGSLWAATSSTGGKHRLRPLDPDATVDAKGVVREAGTDRPIADARVQLGLAVAFTDDQGRYRIRQAFKRRVLWSDVVSKEGFVARESRVGTVPDEVTLYRARTLEIALDPPSNRAPPTSAEVRLFGKFDRGEFRHVDVPSVVDGRVRIDNVEEFWSGRIEVCAPDYQFARRSVGDTDAGEASSAAPVTFELVPAPPVSAQLLYDGVPVPGAPVAVSRTLVTGALLAPVRRNTRSEQLSGAIAAEGDLPGARLTRTDSSGTFTIARRESQRWLSARLRPDVVVLAELPDAYDDDAKIEFREEGKLRLTLRVDSSATGVQTAGGRLVVCSGTDLPVQWTTYATTDPNGDVDVVVGRGEIAVSAVVGGSLRRVGSVEWLDPNARRIPMVVRGR